MEPYEFSLGQSVRVIGYDKDGTVVARATWQSIGRPEWAVFYTVRHDDKEITVSETEVSAA
jgi:hypothetical protein